MKRNLLKLIPAAACVLLAAGCEKDYAALVAVDAEVAVEPQASYDIDWVAAADSVSSEFVKRYYCSENRRGYEGVFSYTDYNRTGDNSNNYWQQAHAMAAMVDYYNRIKVTDPNEAAKIVKYFRWWYEKKGNNYEGNASYRGSYGFGNNFTDDTSWITIALLQMFDATGEKEYYNAAKATFDECIWPRTVLNKYGYLPWKWNDYGANECTNGPGAIAAALLAGIARDNGNQEDFEHYLRCACKCFDQNIGCMSTSGTLGNPSLSYTQGTCMEAGRLIWHLNGNVGYLRKAIQAARGQMNSGGMNEVYQGVRIARNEGTDENNAIFHAVFFHWAARMAADTDIDSFDARVRKELYTYIKRHTTLYWTKGINKAEDAWDKSNFSVLCYEPRALSASGSQGAYTSAAQAIESICMLRNTKFPATPSEQPAVRELVAPQRVYLPRVGFEYQTKWNLDQVFEWETSKTGTVSYQILFDTLEGDFSHPIFVQGSDGNGMKPQATLTGKTLDAIAKLAAPESNKATVKWTVKTFQGYDSVVGVKDPEVKTVVITRNL